MCCQSAPHPYRFFYDGLNGGLREKQPAKNQKSLSTTST